MLRKIPLAQLVEDFMVYPRHDVNPTNVTALADALRAGATLPPIVAEQDTFRVVDGIHRLRAHLRVGDAADKVSVDLRAYESDVELFEDAARLNRVHGQKLMQRDLTKVALQLHEADRTAEQIAAVLSVPTTRIEQILGKVVVVTSDGHESSEAAKPAWWPKVGDKPRVMTPEQASVAGSSNGWRTGQTVRQLTRELEAGLHDDLDEDLTEAFQRLAVVITERLG